MLGDYNYIIACFICEILFIALNKKKLKHKSYQYDYFMNDGSFFRN
jgi:hypothetical protein